MPTGGGKKKHADKIEQDPAVARVQEVLEHNVTYFMANIGNFIKKFDSHLDSALPGNPKARTASFCMTAAATDDTTPLLKRAPSTTDMGAKTASNIAEAAASSPNKEDTTATAAPSVSDPAKTAGDSHPTAAVVVKEDEEEIIVEFPNNDDILEQLRMLKNEAYELTTIFDGIHDWIALSIPEMKEEDNMGVEVMGAVIEQVSSLTDSIRGVYSLELKYLQDRGEMEKALLKCPESRSLALQLEVNDGDTWDEVERAWRVLMRSCLILYSVLSKNMQRIREPRGQKHSMYSL